MALIGVLLGITMCAVAWAIRYLYVRHRKDRTFRDYRISSLESSLVREIASHKEAFVAIHKTFASIQESVHFLGLENASHREAIADLNKVFSESVVSIHASTESIRESIEPIKSGMVELESKTAALAEEAKAKAPKHIRMRAWNEDAVIPEVTK